MHGHAARLVTLDLDDATSAYFEALRAAHYPASKNRVPAHVMLFHRIADEHAATMQADLLETAAGIAPFDVRVAGPRSMGAGVAYDLDAPDLIALRARLATAWRPWLVPQDLERYRPHVVVQNKVDAATARATLATLHASFVPFAARALGLRLWTYRDGTWHEPHAFAFSCAAGN